MNAPLPTARMNTAAPLSWFTQSTRRYTHLIVELMAIAVVLRLLGLVQPFVFQAIIDRVLPFERKATLVLIVAVMASTTAFSAGLGAASAYLGTHMANRLTAELARRIFRHVLDLPLRFLQRWQVGEMLARIDEIGTVRSFLTGTVSGLVLDAVFAVVYVVALLAISPLLTLVVLIMLPLQIIAFGIIGPFVRRRMQASFLAGSRHRSRLVEAFGSAVTVKALASETAQAERFLETLGQSLHTGFRVTRLHILDRAVGHVLNDASVILIIFFGARLVFQDTITLGELVAFHLLAGKVSGPIMSLSSVWEQWQGLKIARLRLGDFLETPAETDPARPRLRIDGPLHLSVRNLWFGYAPDQSVIRALTLDIMSEKPTIIIGGSGCGKSTFGRLLSGLYVPDEGSIAVNGCILSEYDPRSVRRTIGYLPQEPVLFAGTILDNLRMARPGASDEDIACALAGSASDRFVDHLPAGIHTEVGEGGGHLSGGQRQRIALARSLLTDPMVLVLDEPTSALDTQSSEIVVETLRSLARDKTVIVITHNPRLLGDDVDVIDLNHPARYRHREPGMIDA